MTKLFAWLMAAVLAVPQAAQSLNCNTETFEEVPYAVCTVDLAEDDLRLWLNRPDGTPWYSFGALSEGVARTGQTLAFATNAGMYHPDRSPVGHLTIAGERMKETVTSAGPGNFGMLPNGVLCWGDGRAAVIESRQFERTQQACEYATQSGPMLLIDGKLHPRFLADSRSRRIRNGAGVERTGRTLTFALATRPVNFHSFARFFRDKLGAQNALYLDGSISRMFAPSIGRNDRGGFFGPILGVVAPN